MIPLQPPRWRCAEFAVHHERNMREKQHHINVARTSNHRVIMACELCCCLLPQREALRTCHSGFPIATKWCCDQDVEVVRGSAFTQRTCDRCGSLKKEGDVVATSPLSLREMCDSSRTGCARRTTYVCGANRQ